MKLTKKMVEDLKTAGPRLERWDDEVIGLGVRCTALGRKTWTFRYSFYGALYRVTLGEYPSMSLDEARARGTQLRGEVLAGDPPHLQELNNRKQIAFLEFADEFLHKHVLTKLKPSTIKSYRWILTSVLMPAFGPVPIGSIDPAMVQDFHTALADTPRAANLAVTVLGKMMELAEQWQYRDPNSNPCTFLQKFPQRKRERVLDDQELAKLWLKLDELESTGQETASIVGSVRFALLTGLRKMEIMDLEWPDVDLQGKVVKLGRHKTAWKVGHRLVALNDLAVELLLAQPRKAGSGLVFPGERPGCRSNLEQGWDRIRKALGLEDVHFHDLRHTFGTLAAEGGVPLHNVGGTLGHTDGKSTARYAHHTSRAMREAPEAVGKAIDELRKKSS